MAEWRAFAGGDELRGKSGKKRLDVYYDGECPMCVSLVQNIRESDRHDRFVLHDMHCRGELPFDKRAVEREIHLSDASGNVFRGAEAILKIAAQFPSLRAFNRFARLPPARAAAPMVYRFVAANRRFLWGPGARLYGMKVVLLLTFAVELAMCAPLWIGPRSYPPAPVLTALPALGSRLQYGLFAALFASAAAALVSAKPQKYVAVFLADLLLFCIFDQTRWQPWVFQFAFLLGALALFSWDKADTAGRERTLNIARLIVAATYIYSGLQKINLNFVGNEFPWIVQPITNLLPQAAGMLHAFGFAAPFLQVGFGVGLLTHRFRRIALVLAVAMHVFILAMFGPLGQNWNDIIWPWTAAMAAFDLLLFGGRTAATARDIVWPGRHAYHAAVLVLFGVMPAASFFNGWDSYLSSALYSGNLTEAQIYLNDAGRRALPTVISRHLVHTSADTNVINLQHWTIDELNVMPYPETRAFKSVARSICGELRDKRDLVLVVHEQRAFFSRAEAGFRCWDL